MCGYNLCVVPEVMKVPRYQHKARHWSPFLEQSKSAQICQKSKRHLKILAPDGLPINVRRHPTKFIVPVGNRSLCTPKIIHIPSWQLMLLIFFLLLVSYYHLDLPNCRSSRDLCTRFLFQHSLNKMIRLINVWLCCNPDCDLWCSQMRRALLRHIILS
jgi:hypothetical protein